jgi:hypothetical protein
MSFIGAILFVVGAVSAGLTYTGYAPDMLDNVGLSFPVWLGVSMLGAAIIYFNRRPGG